VPNSVLVGESVLVSFFSGRAQQVALAAQYVTARVLGASYGQSLGVASAAKQQKVGDNVSHIITLELTQKAPAQNSNNTDYGPSDPSSLTTGDSSGGGATIDPATGLAIIAHTSTAKPATVATLSFAIAPPSNGFAQTIDVGMNARQSVHQTAAGYYVDEYNEGTGTLNIDVEVLYRTNAPGDEIQNFFSMLHQAKLTEPLASGSPFRLRYHDAYLGQSFIITQDSVRLRIDAERPGRARLTIAATILLDYSQPSASTQPGSSSATAAATAASSLAGLGTFSSFTGQSVTAAFAAVVGAL
jgi:hypothetical protein